MLAFCLGLLSLLPADSQASIAYKGNWGGDFPLPDTNYPQEADFSSNGDIFLALSSRIVRLDEDRQPVAAWNPGVVGDMAVDSDGNVYVSSNYPEVIRKFSNTGSGLGQWTIPGERIEGVAFESGSIYIARESTVERRSLTGQLLDQWAIQNDDDFRSVVISGDDDGHVFAATVQLSGQTATKTIQRFGPTGNVLSTWTSPAEVDYQTYPRVEGSYIVGIDGYRGVAPAPDGGAFVRFWGSDHGVTRLSPTGEIEGGWTGGPEGAGTISIGPDDRLWMNISTYVATFGEFEIDGTEVRRWGPYDLPKYNTGNLGEGKFSGLTDLAIAPDGDVFTLESRNLRVQRFSPTGQFEMMKDEFVDLFGATRLVATSDGGYAALNSFIGQLIRYTADGDVVARYPMNLGGREIRDAIATPDGGFLVLDWGGAGAPGAVTRIDLEGEKTASWKPTFNPRAIAVTSAGNPLLLGDEGVSEFTPDGQALDCWGVDLPRTASGYNPSRYPVDLATTTQGTVFVLTSGDDPELQEYTTGGARTDRTELPGPSENGAEYATRIEASPEGTVYLAGGSKVNRYSWAPSDTTEPALECNPVPSFGIESVEFQSKRRWAKIFLSVPESGRIEMTGGSKVRARSKRIGDGGLFSLNVVPKPRFMKPVRSAKRRKLHIVVRLRYIPDRGTTDQKIVKRITFIRKVKLRQPHR